MNILLVITKAEIGGAQAVVLNLARGLKAVGQEVSVAAGDGSYLPQELKKDEIPFFRLKNLKRSRNPLYTFLFIKELKELIKKEKFIVVHFNSTNTLPGIFAISRSDRINRNIKTVFTVHGLSVLDKNYPALRLTKILFKIYFKYFLHFINKIVFVSQHDFDEAINNNIVRTGSVIYNGLNLDPNYFFNRLKAREKIEEIIRRSLKGVYLIGSIGRLAIQKNYDFLIKNWLKIKEIKPNAKLVIFGDGPKRKKYDNLLKHFDYIEDIFFPGKLVDASQLLKGLDLFILPSIYEGLSISLIEAIFAGISVLASDVGGNKEIIGDVNCFQLGDKLDFVNKFKQEKFIKAKKMQFSAEIMVKKYIELYEGK